MKRNRISRIEADEVGGMDISSLVDICFLLLIYFIVTSTVMPRESDLPTGPPGERPSGLKVEIEPFLIRIDGAGQVFADQGSQMVPLDTDPNVRDLPMLEDMLKMYEQGVKASGQQSLVVIDVHNDVKTQRVIDVLNTLAGLEIKNVSFRDPIEE